MKKIMLVALFISSVNLTACAQTLTSPKENSTAFEVAMLKNIRQLDTASSAETLIMLANNFERIARAEKNKWQPFYYASYCYTAMAFMTPDKTKIDFLADKAENYLVQAETIQKNNSEISCLFAMINSCRIMVDPVSRFQTKGKEVNALLSKAKEENPDNPRIYLLQARMQLRTPEAFGGGVKPAKESVEKAVQKFSSFKAENAIAPSWGEGQAKALLAKISKSN